jgi:nucleotide-binding universal stress UspA family protein
MPGDAMPSLRSIRVHLDQQPASAHRLQVGRHLAAQHGAVVAGVYAVPPCFSQVPLAADISPSALAALRELDDERRRVAHATFEAAMREPGPYASWAEVGSGAVFGDFVHEALFADLLVLGQRPAAGSHAGEMPADFAESVVIASGRPAVVVPHDSSEPATGHRVVVAWKATREAMRAVTAALPLLQKADQVHLANWSEPDLEPPDFAAIEHYLRHHDVEPKRHAFGRSSAVGDAMLALCRDVSADLLVMGCYGHTRFRELVLGGASRTVLRSMHIPVLIAH